MRLRWPMEARDHAATFSAEPATGLGGGNMPRERFGPAELLGRLEGTQPHNERPSRCPRDMPRGPAGMP